MLKTLFSSISISVVMVIFASGCATMQSHYRVNKLHEDKEWEDAIQKNTIIAYKEFIKRYSTSHIEEVLKRVKAQKFSKQIIDSTFTCVYLSQQGEDVLDECPKHPRGYWKNVSTDFSKILFSENNMIVHYDLDGNRTISWYYERGSLLIFSNDLIYIFDSKDWWEIP